SSFAVASSRVAYSSNSSTSASFARRARVEVTFSSPLKNDPRRLAPSPSIAIRNGISTPFTVTVASQRPANEESRAALPGRIAVDAAIARTISVLISTPKNERSRSGRSGRLRQKDEWPPGHSDERPLKRREVGAALL